MNKKYYLAYGSNLDTRQMMYRCPEAKLVGTSIIHDYELLFKGSKTGSYLTIEPKKGSEVPVAVWEVTEGDEANLDRYEGFPTFYYKKEMRVPLRRFGTEEHEIDAFVYIMHEERHLGVPSRLYYQICCEGYEAFGFDFKLLTKAYRKSCVRVYDGR